MEAGNESKNTREGWRKDPIPEKACTFSFPLFPLHTQHTLFLTFHSRAGLKVCCLPVTFTLPACLYAVHLSRSAAFNATFLLLLCPSLSAYLPRPLFPLLSLHDINTKGRLCSLREIYCFFESCLGFLWPSHRASQPSPYFPDRGDKHWVLSVCHIFKLL